MRKQMFDLHYLTFWGIIVIAIGTIIGTILIQRGNVLKSRESSQKTQAEIQKLSIQNAEIKLQNLNLKEIAEKQTDLLNVQSALLDHQMKFISGGDGFPYVEMKKVSSQGKDDLFVYCAENSFDYPLYNVQIQAFNYDKLIQKVIITEKGKSAIKMSDYLDARIFEFKTEEIGPKTYRMNPEQFVVTPGIVFLNIHSRNKRVVQKIAIVQRGLQFYSGYIVIDDNEKVIKREIYNNPPKDIQDDIMKKLDDIPNDFDFIFLQ